MIGPYQIDGARIWFGKNFYDGEGDTGVGAFGYFDTSTRAYTLFSPPATHQIKTYPVEFVVESIRAEGDSPTICT